MAAYSGPQLKLKDFLPYKLSILSNRISGAIANAYQDRFGLTIPEWRVMAIVADSPGLSAGDVAERSEMDKVAVSRAVARLVESGRLERHLADDDKRRSELSLSDDGNRIYAEVVPIAKAYEAAVLSHLNDEERARLDELLDKLDEVEDKVLRNPPTARAD